MRPPIVIVGRNGQLARALAASLPAAGFIVATVGRPACDIVDAEALRAAIIAASPALVINAAAYTAVDKAEDDPDAAFAVNRDGARNVAAATAMAGVPVIHYSTDYVFDGAKGAPYREDDPTHPLGVYGASKLAGEQAVAEANARHVILRTAWVCGADGANFVKTMLRLAATRGEIGVVEDQIGAPSFATDLAAATARVAARVLRWPGDPSLYGTFHMTGAGETSWCGLARAIFARSRARGGPWAHARAITTADYPTRARRPADSRLDCSKLARRYGIVMPEWRDGLEDCLDQLLGGPLREANAS
jgi:dTDP-4-dehydrorhamnose reductase